MTEASNKRVLVVDDEALVCTLTAALLRELGYAVEISNGGEAALRVLKEGPPVDALMTDIRMPNVNGFELARRVVERWPSTKVVYMTGYTVPATVPDAAIPGLPEAEAARLRETPIEQGTALDTAGNGRFARKVIVHCKHERARRLSTTPPQLLAQADPADLVVNDDDMRRAIAAALAIN